MTDNEGGSMTLAEIEALWAADSKIDQVNLDRESLRSPELHSKYWNILIRERMGLRKMKTDLVLLKEDINTYLDHKADDELLARRGWEPNNYVKMPNALIERKIAAHPDLIALQLRMGLQEEKVELLIDIIKMINFRTNTIKNAIEYRKFTQT